MENIQQIIEECRKKFPVGVKYRAVNGYWEGIIHNNSPIEEYDTGRFTVHQLGNPGFLYYNEKYATVLKYPQSNYQIFN